MSGNTFGHAFTVTTFGESHGPALGCIVDGCPPGLELAEEDIQRDVDRRRSGTSRYTSQRREPDTVRILSGLFEGRTTGTPIGLLVGNEDQRSYDYEKIKDRFRPGHADYTYQQKYGFRDYRGGGRSSARETVMRVAAGAIARRLLAVHAGVSICGYLSQAGPVRIEPRDLAEIDRNPFFCPDPSRVGELEALIDGLRRDGDSVGARVTVIAQGVPPGLGEPVFDRLDADLAHAMMGINAVKGVEVGDGFRVVEQRGSQHRDAGPDDRRARAASGGEHDGAPRSMCRHARGTDSGGDDGSGAGGPLPAAPGTECPRAPDDPRHHAAGLSPCTTAELCVASAHGWPRNVTK